MEPLAVIVALLTLLLGAVVGYLYGRRTSPSANQTDAQLAISDARQDAASARAEASRAREDAAMAKAEIAQHLAEKSSLRAEVAEAQRVGAEAQGTTARAEAELAKVQARVAAAMAERDAAIAKAEEQAKDREILLDRFKVLSAESLERQGTLADAAAEQRFKATEQLVAPLTEGLRRMQEQLQSVEKERVRMAAELGEQVNAVRLSGEAIRTETRSLSNALRTPQVRGAWGETSLKRIVEISGLTERVDFDTQHTYTSQDGRLRPDMRVNLPQGKVIFVDAKVPLGRLLEAYNTEDEEQQKAHFAAFAKRVREHVGMLADKNYWQLDQGSPEFVVLYLPSDEVYRMALELEPDLHDYATRRHVVLASPGLLIPQLQIVANGWKQVALAETAGQVSKLGRELYERLATLGSHFDKLGRSLSGAVSNYNKAVATMESRIMVSARRFRDLEVVSEPLDEIRQVQESTREIAVAEMLDYQDMRAKERHALNADPLIEMDGSLHQMRSRASGKASG